MNKTRHLQLKLKWSNIWSFKDSGKKKKTVKIVEIVKEEEKEELPFFKIKKKKKNLPATVTRC